MSDVAKFANPDVESSVAEIRQLFEAWLNTDGGTVMDIPALFLPDGTQIWEYVSRTEIMQRFDLAVETFLGNAPNPKEVES